MHPVRGRDSGPNPGFYSEILGNVSIWSLGPSDRPVLCGGGAESLWWSLKRFECFLIGDSSTHRLAYETT